MLGFHTNYGIATDWCISSCNSDSPFSSSSSLWKQANKRPEWQTSLFTSASPSPSDWLGFHDPGAR